MIRKILHFEKQAIQGLSTAIERYLLWFVCLFLLAFGGLMIYKAAVDYGFLWDQTEHLHAAYLVSTGMVPYRDFFEHHHPLLWYLLAPAVQWFYPSLKIVYVARGLSLICLAGEFVLFYLIVRRFLFDGKTALVSVFCLISIPRTWVDMMNLRPDAFMLLTALGALYCFFAYLQNGRLRNLIISYTLMVISFLFLQKAFMIGVGLGAVNLWLLYKKKLSWRDFFMAVGVAILPLLGFAAWLSYHHIWAEYFWYNWSLNSLMLQYYNGYSEISLESKGLFWAGLLVVLYVNKRALYKIKNAGLVWFVCTLTTFAVVCSFMPHLQYLLPIFLLIAPYVGYLLTHIITHLIKWLLLVLCATWSIYDLRPTPVRMQKFTGYMDALQFINNEFAPNQEVIGLFFPPCNIYRPDAHFYWFGFKDVAVIDVLTNPQVKDFDLQQIIMTKKPRYVFYSWFPQTAEKANFQWFAERNKMILDRIKKEPAARNRFFEVVVPPLPSFWPVDENWLQQYYEKIENTHIWRRKENAPQ